MEKRVYAVRGMSCAACALKVERAVKELNGVSEVNVMLLQNRLTLRCEEGKLPYGLIESAVKAAGYEAQLLGSAAAFSTDKKANHRQLHRLIGCLVLTALIMVLGMGGHLSLHLVADPLLNGLLQLALTLLVMLLQAHYFTDAFAALRHLSFNMNSLVSLGSLVSFVYSCVQLLGGNPHELYFEGAACILTFVAIGKYVEERSKLRTTDAVSALYDLAPKFVRVLEDGKESLVPCQEVRRGQLVLLKSGDQVGVDGVLVKGRGHLDESTLTGEARPVLKEPGDQILSSTVLLDGVMQVRAEAVGEDTTLSKIIALVNDTIAHKAPAQRLADRIAGIFVPAVILISLLVFGVWYFLLSSSLGQALTFATSVLVVSCPCALGLATPVAIMAGTGRAAERGILFKNPQSLEVLQRATLFAFDKTGTLTHGNMTVRHILSRDQDLTDLNLTFAASLEQNSAHPLARALLRCAEGKVLFEVTDFQEHAGEGVSACIAGVRYALGNEKLGKTLGARFTGQEQECFATYAQLGQTTLALFREQEPLCLFVIGDEPKSGAGALMAKLHAAGRHTLMLTGDTRQVAQAVSSELGVQEYRAELLPADKAELLKAVQGQGHQVVMVGDGINDSVSLSCADVGIGVAGASDLALSACDVVLLRADLMDVYNALQISDRTVSVIRENLFWAFIYNIIFIPLAAGALYLPFGIQLTPMYAALLMSLSSVCVVLNALRLTRLELLTGQDQRDQAFGENEEGRKMHKQLSIEGMHCEHCVAAVRKYLSALPGVSEVQVSLDKAQATLLCPEAVSDELLQAAVQNAGFRLKEIRSC